MLTGMRQGAFLCPWGRSLAVFALQVGRLSCLLDTLSPQGPVLSTNPKTFEEMKQVGKCREGRRGVGEGSPLPWGGSGKAA